MFQFMKSTFNTKGEKTCHKLRQVSEYEAIISKGGRNHSLSNSSQGNITAPKKHFYTASLKVIIFNFIEYFRF